MLIVQRKFTLDFIRQVSGEAPVEARVIPRKLACCGTEMLSAGFTKHDDGPLRLLFVEEGQEEW